jgi:predicted Rossmann-fold nucleotide-binding protein
VKILVCGGRNYRDEERVYDQLDTLQEIGGVSLIIEGGAHGADSLARRWAHDRGIHCVTMLALWDHYGPSAGPKRNAAMLLLQPDLVMAFPGGAGTADMVKKARERKIDVMEIAP